MKLYVCYGTFRSPRPGRASVRQRLPGAASRRLRPGGRQDLRLGLLPDALNTGPAQGGQEDDRQLMGLRCSRPTTAEVISGSKEIAAWAQEHPAGTRGRSLK